MEGEEEEEEEGPHFAAGFESAWKISCPDYLFLYDFMVERHTIASGPATEDNVWAAFRTECCGSCGHCEEVLHSFSGHTSAELLPLYIGGRCHYNRGVCYNGGCCEVCRPSQGCLGRHAC